MQLTQEQTKRINDFLEGIGVNYIDIRYEMVDHIATEIEEKVTDIDAFFENQRFQTIFVKYMLSKKDALQKKYQKIVKRRFWGDTKTICKNMSIETLKIKNLLFLALLTSLTYSLSLFNTKNALIILFILSVALYCYNGYTLHRIFKKYGQIKLVQSYTLLLGFISYIPLYIINNPFTIYSEKHFELWKLYTHTIFIYLVFLLCKVLLNDKEKIDAKYRYLTE
ncbi:hypothetical protein [Tenacibaculum haliotis]|uniref:hypothetical protein n=1 Tax=Tenacibaculum haliotis TaxID=1888914 RepID=UPI0021AF1386|nr:hypothetical protein [Tenacibaculum haliotis]MCT4698364.1 hypothetical protein [Tenacibaculum haliotis]